MNCSKQAKIIIFEWRDYDNVQGPPSGYRQTRGVSDHLECIQHHLSHYTHGQVTFTLANKLVLCESFFYSENRMVFPRWKSDVFTFKPFMRRWGEWWHFSLPWLQIASDASLHHTLLLVEWKPISAFESRYTWQDLSINNLLSLLIPHMDLRYGGKAAEQCGLTYCSLGLTLDELNVRL